jgi:hypothetical protein
MSLFFISDNLDTYWPTMTLGPSDDIYKIVKKWSWSRIIIQSSFSLFNENVKGLALQNVKIEFNTDEGVLYMVTNVFNAISNLSDDDRTLNFKLKAYPPNYYWEELESIMEDYYPF